MQLCSAAQESLISASAGGFMSQPQSHFCRGGYLLYLVPGLDASISCPTLSQMSDITVGQRPVDRHFDCRLPVCDRGYCMVHCRRDERGILYYTLEYTVKGPAFFRHNLSVYASSRGLLYTLNGQAAQERWEDQRLVQQFEQAAKSFHIM